MNKLRSAKLAHSWRAALMTILSCDWALANGVEFYDGQGQLIDDWESNGSVVADSQAFFRGRRVDAGFCFIATREDCARLRSVTRRTAFYQPTAADRRGRVSSRGYARPCVPRSFTPLGTAPRRGVLRVEGKLRQSVRRWLSEREVLSRLGYAQYCRD